MSIRIHQLSKKIGMENKELISLLQERGFQVKSASSTIDNISAESLVDEFEKKAADEAKAAEAEAEAAPAPEPEAPAEETPKAEPEQKSAPSNLPPGVFVKSAEQVKQERIDKEEARRAVVTPAPVRPVPPPAPPPVSASPAQPAQPAQPTPPPPTPQPTSMAPPRPGPANVPPPVASPTNMAPPPPPNRPGAGAAESAADEPETEAPAADDGDVKVIQIKPPIVVRDFANLLGMKPFKLISEMMEMGIFAALNQSIEEDVASQLAVKHGFLLDVKHRGDSQPAKESTKEKEEEKVDESKLLEPRPPVVCIMGHVDHGKTSLLDRVRSANVVAGEAGGITQHIGAYQVKVNDRAITFIDTPGHAAFNEMRARGANVTDIAILVVAADDGFMPQTDEALQYIRTAGVTPIVAINKIDTKGANIDRVKTQMQERNLAPEDWGGETVCVPISALKGDGVDELLDMILLQADVLELKANPKGDVQGVVIEAEIEVGRGPTATVLIESGTLKTGSTVVCGPFYAKVRAMFDDQGKQVKSAPPSSAVRVIGWSGTPECGGIVKTVKNEREAKRITEEVAFDLKRSAVVEPTVKPVSIEQMFEAIALQQSKVLRVVVKADVFGSCEAVVSGLNGIKSDKVNLEIIENAVGPISKNDVIMASASSAIVVGFGVRSEPGVGPLAKHHGVEILIFDIIYELVDTIRDRMADLLEPETRETKVGVAEVRAVFPVARGFVAGCLVVEGRVQTDINARVRRGNKIEHEGKVITVRRVKDEVKEVRAGTECGIQIEGYNNFKPGDFIECFDVEKIRASL